MGADLTFLLSGSTLYTKDTIVSWLNALANRTSQLSYRLSIGTTNLSKLSDTDIAIATVKIWTLT